MDELIGSLFTIEMAINEKSKKTNNGVSFKADIENDEEQVKEDTN